MVDLKNQYLKIKRDVDSAIESVINSTQFINGKAVHVFAEELADFLNVRHVIPCANGTDALQIALMSLDLEPGEEVITTPFTFAATVEVIVLLGLRPRFVDIDPRTYNMDTSQLEAAITPRTACIMPVHLFGMPCNMTEVMRVAEANDIAVIEDNAQAIGAVYRWPDGREQMAGTIGDFGCTSFFPSKNLGCFGDGGALFTNDESLYQRARMIANHGSHRRYHHSEIGINSRLDSIQAAILSVKLRHLPMYNRLRRQAAQQYDSLLASAPGIDTPVIPEGYDHIFHQYTIRLSEQRDQLRQHLQDRGIPTGVYYPIPLHLQEAYRSETYSEGDFPHSEKAAAEVLSLPMHTELTSETQSYITDRVLEYAQAVVQ